jgi:hypothetical protein
MIGLKDKKLPKSLFVLSLLTVFGEIHFITILELVLLGLELVVDRFTQLDVR